MHGWIVWRVSATISCIRYQHSPECRYLGDHFTVVLRSIVWRWRTIAAKEVGSKGQTGHGSEHSAWTNTTIGDFSTQGEVSSFFGHVNGSQGGIEKGLKERIE